MVGINISVKRISVPVFIVFYVLLLSACDYQYNDIHDAEIIEHYSEKIIQNNPTTLHEDLSEERIDTDALTFDTIINNYRILEQNVFIDPDREPEVRSDQLHPITWRYNNGMSPTYWRLMYAFHDITGDERIEITEEEYLLLIDFFGSSGYETNRIESPRPVNIEWRYIISS